MPLLEGKPSMDIKIMKNTKNTILKWILGACLLFAGAQSAFALQCEGNIYIKAPASWTMVTLEAGGMFPKLSVGASGWYEAKAAAVGQGQSFRVNSTGTSYPAQWIDKNGYDIANNESQNADAFTCDDLAAGDLYIYENPAEPGKTAYSNNPPNAKYLYVMIPPDFEEWMSAVPMVSMDGGKTGKPLNADPDKCGWYYYVWFNEEISDEVVLYRDDDAEREDMIGLNGNWETSPNATPIPLNMLFSMVDTLYFVPDEEQLLNPGDDGFYYTFPEGVEGVCSYTMAAIIYDTDAKLHPAFSCYSQGGEGCQTGALGIDQMTAVAAVNRCIGVTPGIVNPTLDPSVPQAMRKPTLSTFGKQCFINDDLFNAMFNYTEGVNEKSCYDMPFSRSEDGKWEFDSDFHKTYVQVSAGKFDSIPGGFYPVENSTDESILLADPTQKPVAAARQKRGAEGAIFYGPVLRELDPVEGVPVIDLLCNGPGWSGGYDCSGIFADGDATDAFIKLAYPAAQCVIGWSCPDNAPRGWQFYKDGTQTKLTTGAPRWSGMRNQHYCFESHAKFTQKPGLRFNFRGDDDIWVFIDNKLAVDLGGTHLAAPGYVDLDKFEGLSGKLETDNEYDLDIFFCDRRTTMSNVRIKTNMYIRQKTDISTKPTKHGGTTSYEMCYTKSGDGSCAGAMSGVEEAVECCGAEFGTKAGCPTADMFQYYLVSGKVLTSEMMTPENLLVNGKVHKGGIDLTNPTSPVVNKEAVSLPPGRWSLFAVIEGKQKKVAEFRMTGDVDVLYAHADALDSNGVPLKNGKYTFVGSAMGAPTQMTLEDLVPVYISALSEEESGKLYMLPDDAVGVNYTLDVSPAGLTIYAKNENGSLDIVTPGMSRTIGATGIDTVYVTRPLLAMDNVTETFTVKVTGRPKGASITFYLPTLAFVDSTGAALNPQGDAPDASGNFEERWVGSYYDLYMVALKPDLANPGNFTPCDNCNFTFTLGSTTSARIDAKNPDELKFVEGKATISVRSLKEYRYDPSPELNNPAQVVVTGENAKMAATYFPIYFREPPVPYPVLADIFDVKGATPEGELNIPSPYFNMTQEYLDGIADSMAIYYNRRIHVDSLPTKICIQWDSTSAEKHDPTAEGFSNRGETDLLCNALEDVPASYCENKDAEGYCDPIIKLGGLSLSKEIKTYGDGKVYSYAVFVDKGKEIKQGFDGAITDRIAPVIITARVKATSEGSTQDILTIDVSEPVKIVGDIQSSFVYYLNSATSLTEDQRFAISSVVAVDGSVGGSRISMMYNRGANDENITPHVGDYIRFRGGIEELFWSDTSKYVFDGTDTLRAAADAAYSWNYPTAYNESKRLPSPWAPVIGEAKVTVKTNSFAHTGNAPEGDNVPAITVKELPTNMSFEDAVEAVGGIPGHFVESDMNALIFSDEKYSDYFAKNPAELENVYFYYQVEYFTNLGNYVASQSGKIYCDDKKNKIKYFGGDGKTCMDGGAGRNFYVGWNMRSDEGRMVSTGAYIVKFQSYVKLAKQFGKKKSLDDTSVWGVKRGSALPVSSSK